jgi:hypothetical protein
MEGGGFMKTILGLLVVLALAATPTLAQKVTIDYAHDFDFGKVETFQYVQTKDTDSPDELMDARIRDAIVRELTAGGLKQVDADPDLYVTYHITTKENTVLNTTNFGYGGYGPGWGGWGMGVGVGSSTTTASTYTEGTLVIDGYDSVNKRMVWRGSGTVTVAEKPEKRNQQVDQILTKLGNKWEKILRKKGK